eukprot:1167985-Rhodomonas_salina.5
MRNVETSDGDDISDDTELIVYFWDEWARACRNVLPGHKLTLHGAVTPGFLLRLSAKTFQSEHNGGQGSRSWTRMTTLRRQCLPLRFMRGQSTAVPGPLSPQSHRPLPVLSHHGCPPAPQCGHITHSLFSAARVLCCGDIRIHPSSLAGSATSSGSFRTLRVPTQSRS